VPHPDHFNACNKWEEDDGGSSRAYELPPSIVIALPFVLQSRRTLRHHRPLPPADPAVEETEDMAAAFVSLGVDLSQLKLNIM